MTPTSAPTVPEKWQTPQVVDKVTEAFPALIIGELLPEQEEIPEDFQRDTAESEPWKRLMSACLFHGIGAEAQFFCKDGVDGQTALTHLITIIRSYQPKHEHKEAGWAWLASLWFHGVRYVPDDEQGAPFSVGRVACGETEQGWCGLDENHEGEHEVFEDVEESGE